MYCEYCEKCGGCSYNIENEISYKKEKQDHFMQILKGLNQDEINYGQAIFIPESTRRRASFVFNYKKGKAEFGFNEKASHNIISIEKCPLLTPMINRNIPIIKSLLLELCKTPIEEKIKKGKVKISYISNGDISVCEADNGLDIVIETKEKLSLNHHMIISEFMHNYNDIIRISQKKDTFDEAETIAEKAKPLVKIADIDVFISAGTFLQASKEGENALIKTVTKYVDKSQGKIADLFCGIGTFSYPLSKNKNNNIIAVDSSKSLLDGFKKSINKNMITNIEIMQKNLFKYPLDEQELKYVDIVIFDPPRAGAYAQISKIAEIETKNQPKKIIAVSCNPYSFVKDANLLLSSGYIINEITFIDQFTYSNHCELVALFTKQG